MSNNPVVYEDKIVSLNLSARAYNYCQRNRIQTISSLIDFYKDNGCMIPNNIHGIGNKTLVELARVCQSFLCGLYSLKQDCNQSLLAHCGLSVRAYNYCIGNKLFTLEDLLVFYKKNNFSIPHRINAGVKTISELESFCSSKVDIVSDSQTVFGKEIFEDDTDSVDSNIPSFYISSLSTDDKKYLNDFYVAKDHFPVLWIINKTYNYDQDVQCLFFTTPAISGHNFISFTDFASREGVTYSCIKQRYERAVIKLFNGRNKWGGGKVKHWRKLINSNISQYLTSVLDNLDFISIFDFEKTSRGINLEEHTNFSALFLLQLISNISGEYYVDGGYDSSGYSTDICLIHNSILDVFDFIQFSKEFDELLNACDVFSKLNIRNYIEDSLLWKKFSYEHVDRVLKVCKSYILHKYGLYEITTEDVIEIVPSKVNWAEVVYSMLSKEPSGLTMEEIVYNISSQYPHYKIVESAVRRAIDSDIRIQYQRGLYGQTKFLLAKYDVPNSVRDAIIRKLDLSNIPVSLDDIIAFVQIYFPSASQRSIRTTMTNDSRSRFTPYEDGLWGLSSKSYPNSYKTIEIVSHQGFEERLISLKQFISEKKRYPDGDSKIDEEVSLARWIERNSDKAEVKALIDEFRDNIWKINWAKCEAYIIEHHKKLPTRESDLILYKWYSKAMDDYRNDNLTQEQRKLMLKLAMQIR